MRSFQKDFERSKEDMKHPRWDQIRQALGVVKQYETTPQQDRVGVDAIWEWDSGKQYKMEIKVRWTDRDWGDFCFEVWSSMEDKKPGWAMDESKISDLLLVDYPNQRTCYLLPYQKLVEWFRGYWAENEKELWTWQERNQGYTTFFAHVKREVVYQNIPKYRIVEYEGE